MLYRHIPWWFTLHLEQLTAIILVIYVKQVTMERPYDKMQTMGSESVLLKVFYGIFDQWIQTQTNNHTTGRDYDTIIYN